MKDDDTSLEYTTPSISDFGSIADNTFMPPGKGRGLGLDGLGLENILNHLPGHAFGPHGPGIS